MANAPACVGVRVLTFVQRPASLSSVFRYPPSSHRPVSEIKHNGYRLMVRKAEDRVRIYTRRGADCTERFPRIVEAVRKLKADSILLDEEVSAAERRGVLVVDFAA